METGDEPEQERQVEGLQADRDRDRDPVLRMEGEDLLDRVPEGGAPAQITTAFWISNDAASVIAVPPTIRSR
ncbi:hypothetical protein [Agilicoccus flavus]|uniref:hypothetical protein n=1 Tax=Agilicoccus flavus TaxID=2775968 RepID=UPI001CF6E8FD|nr:hypothetical protein [Agilicoccus flavus]